MNNGLPDRAVLTDNGRTVYIETKSKGKPLRPLQKWWRNWLNDNKHWYIKFDCMNEALWYDFCLTVKSL